MWLNESNRPLHLKYGIPTALFGTIVFTAGVSVGMGFKDWQNRGKFDWLDVAATMIGGLIGQILQLCIIFIICLLV